MHKLKQARPQWHLTRLKTRSHKNQQAKSHFNATSKISKFMHLFPHHRAVFQVLSLYEFFVQRASQSSRQLCPRTKHLPTQTSVSLKKDDQKWNYTWTLMLNLRCWQSTLVQWPDLQTCARPPEALGSVPSSPASTAAPSGCKTNKFHNLFSKETCFIVKIQQQSKHKYLSVIQQMTINEGDFMTVISSVNIKLHSSFHRRSSAFSSILDT